MALPRRLLLAPQAKHGAPALEPRCNILIPFEQRAKVPFAKHNNMIKQAVHLPVGRLMQNLVSGTQLLALAEFARDGRPLLNL